MKPSVPLLGVVAQKFWPSVSVQDESECWEWSRGRQSKGYGVLYVHGRSTLAHRVAYSLVNGPIPEGLCVLHRCDNPPCCNPAHLFVGTISDNHADMRAKGRVRTGRLYGLAHPNSRLTEAQVRDLRRDHAAGVSVSGLARKYGLSWPNAKKAALGRSYQEVQ